MNYPNNITIDRLRYFSKAAQLEHVGRAAKALNLTPPVISSAIRVLEDELGHLLFTREKQRIKLTEEGRRLLDLAQEIIRSTASLKDSLSLKPSTINGHFRIGASHFLMKEFVVQATTKISALHPGITFELSSLDTAMAISKVQAGLLDYALVFRSSYKDKILEEILWSGNFQIAVKRNHPLLKITSGNRHTKLSDLPAISFRTSGGGNFWELHPALTALGLIPKSRFFYDDTEIAIKLIEETSGWAFLPEIIIQSDSRLRALGPTKAPKAPVNISLVKGESERIRVFLPLFKEILQASFKKE